MKEEEEGVCDIFLAEIESLRLDEARFDISAETVKREEEEECE